MIHKPGTKTLSQNPLLRMLSIDSMPDTSSCEFVGAIVGGKVEMSAAGPISPLKLNSGGDMIPSRLAPKRFKPFRPSSPFWVDSPLRV